MNLLKYNLIKRIVVFIFSILIGTISGYWIFIPICLIYLMYIEKPAELILIGVLIDYNNYLGYGFLINNMFFFLSIIVFMISTIMQKTTNMKNTTI